MRAVDMLRICEAADRGRIRHYRTRGGRVLFGAAALLARARERYNPGQLRDPHSGEWANGGMLANVREVLSSGDRVGSPDMAERLAWSVADIDSGPDEVGFEHVGSGSQREAWLDPPDTVYKIGDDSANRHEARVLSEARAKGRDYAPDVTLYEVEVEENDPYGFDGPQKRTMTVVAMPYLPEDGSVDHEGIVFPEAADFNTDNVVSNGGKLWLIDAGGM